MFIGNHYYSMIFWRNRPWVPQGSPGALKNGSSRWRSKRERSQPPLVSQAQGAGWWFQTFSPQPGRCSTLTIVMMMMMMMIIIIIIMIITSWSSWSASRSKFATPLNNMLTGVVTSTLSSHPPEVRPVQRQGCIAHFIFLNIWDNPSQLTFIFFKMAKTTNQIYSYYYPLVF